MSVFSVILNKETPGNLHVSLTNFFTSVCIISKCSTERVWSSVPSDDMRDFIVDFIVFAFTSNPSPISETENRLWHFNVVIAPNSWAILA